MVKGAVSLAKRRATIADLEDVPDGMNGELVDGELVVSPRPSSSHALAASLLGSDLVQAYHRGTTGPGGWWILDEPELLFDPNVVIPDIGGWRRERMPDLPNVARMEIESGRYVKGICERIPWKFQSRVV